MNDALHPLAIAKQPTQQRAKERFDRILKEAETLLNEQGLTGFSIPALAERLGYTRGSVYAYFPTPYALLNELVHRYLGELETVFTARREELRDTHWSEGIKRVVDIAVAFHNSKPAARLLILGGAVTDDSYRAQEITNKHLGDFARALWPAAKGSREPPNLMTLSADIGTACFRRSFFEHGEITPVYRDAAIAAMTGFLASYRDLPPPASAKKKKR